MLYWFLLDTGMWRTHGLEWKKERKKGRKKKRTTKIKTERKKEKKEREKVKKREKRNKKKGKKYFVFVGRRLNKEKWRKQVRKKGIFCRRMKEWKNDGKVNGW